MLPNEDNIVYVLQTRSHKLPTVTPLNIFKKDKHAWIHIHHLRTKPDLLAYT